LTQALTARRSADELHVDLSGEWRVATLSQMDRTLSDIDLAGVRHVHFDTSHLAVLDFSTAWRLREFIERVRQLDGEISFDGGEPEQL
jgi:hypothetical protein